MSKYSVYLEMTLHKYVEIEAEDYDEAYQKGIDMLDKVEFSLDDSIGCNVEVGEKIED